MNPVANHLRHIAELNDTTRSADFTAAANEIDILTDEVARLKEKCEALAAEYGEIEATGATPGPIVARLRHTADRHRLVEHSTIEIEGVEYPIPARVPNGGILAPRRICHTLAKAGYRPVGDYRAALGVDGPGTIAVERA
jgi:hypothetical protein